MFAESRFRRRSSSVNRMSSRLWDIFIWLYLNRRLNWSHRQQATLEKREWKAQHGRRFIVWGAWMSSVHFKLHLVSSNVLWRSLESNRTVNIYREVHADLSIWRNIWRIKLMIQEFRNHLRNMIKKSWRWNRENTGFKVAGWLIMNQGSCIIQRVCGLQSLS